MTFGQLARVFGERRRNVVSPRIDRLRDGRRAWVGSLPIGKRVMENLSERSNRHGSTQSL